jgi:hypothetical protein
MLVSHMDSWAIKEFESISLGDKRLNKRAIKLLSNLSHQPFNSIPDACKGWSETKAAYRFFSNPKVTSDAILSSHKAATIERVKQHKRVFLIQDTTELNYSSQKQKEGVGPSKNDHDRVLFLHPSIIVSSERLCLGVYDDYQWHRKELTRRHSTRNQAQNARLHKQHISEKESYRWLCGYRKANEIANLCTNTHVVMIADREGDIYDIYDEANNTNGQKADWLIRINKNRVLLDVHGKKANIKLYEHVENLKPCQLIEFQLPSRNGDVGRKLQQELRVAKVKLHPPTGRRGALRLEPVETTVLFAKEINTPEGIEPIEWWIMTSFTLGADIKPSDLILWYLSRWDIEIFFRILKSGCQIEKLQLTKPERYRPCLALYCIIAWRILFLSSIAKIAPNSSCSTYFDDDEWQAAYVFINNKKPPKIVPDVQTIIVCIATMGGYLNRKNDSPPGPKAMWQGLSQLYNFLQINSIYQHFSTYG